MDEGGIRKRKESQNGSKGKSVDPPIKDEQPAKATVLQKEVSVYVSLLPSLGSWERVSLCVHKEGFPPSVLYYGAGDEYQAVPQQPSLLINSTMIPSLLLYMSYNPPTPEGRFKGEEKYFHSIMTPE